MASTPLSSWTPLDTGRQAAVCQRRPNLGPAPLIPFSYAEKIAAQPDFCNEFSIGKRLEGWWKVTLSNCGNAFESTSMTGAQPFAYQHEVRGHRLLGVRDCIMSVRSLISFRSPSPLLIIDISTLRLTSPGRSAIILIIQHHNDHKGILSLPHASFWRKFIPLWFYNPPRL